MTVKIDSHTILDCNGADKLLGSVATCSSWIPQDVTLKRLYCAYLSDDEIDTFAMHNLQIDSIIKRAQVVSLSSVRY